MRAVIRRISFGGFKKDVLLLVGGTTAAQAVIVAVSPLLTRLYTPGDFGVLAVFTSLVAILSVVGTFRYELAIPLPAEDATAANLLIAGSVCTLGVSALLLLLDPIAGDWVTQVTGSPQLRPYLWLLPPTLLALSLYQLLGAWAVRRRHFSLLARRAVWQGFAQATAQAALGAAGVRPAGLLLGLLIGRCVGVGDLVRRVWTMDRPALAGASLRGALRSALRYRRFPIFSSWSGVINSAGLQAPVLMLAALYGPVVAGFFALTTRVIGLPVTLVGQAASQVYLSEASIRAREDRRQLRGLFLDTGKKLLLLGLVPIGALAVAGPWLFAVVFGESWRAAGDYARLLAPMYALQFAIVPVSQTLNVLERQDLQLAWDVMRLTLTAGIVFAAHALGMSAAVAILLYGGAAAASYLALFLLSLVGLGRAQRCRASV